MLIFFGSPPPAGIINNDGGGEKIFLIFCNFYSASTSPPPRSPNFFPTSSQPSPTSSPYLLRILSAPFSNLFPQRSCASHVEAMLPVTKSRFPATAFIDKSGKQ